MKKIRIGTRGSKLALYQAYRVKEELENKFSNQEFEIIIIKTKGDKILDVPLSKIGDKGLFTKELEYALFRNEIDMAVHSLKDLPTKFPQGTKLGAILKRGDFRDCLVSKDHKKIEDFDGSEVIATSSLRRKAQLLKINKNFKIVEIRGNVNTRIRKMAEGHCDAMIMAAAGLQRLEMGEHITEIFDPEVMISACGQGAIGIEIREEDAMIEKLISSISDKDSWITAETERAFLSTLEGGCQIPVGCHCRIEGDQVVVKGFISSIDGSEFLCETAKGNVSDSFDIAIKLANDLFNSGGKEILMAIRNEHVVNVTTSSSLEGKRIISTRPIEISDDLSNILKDCGAEVLSMPMIEITPTELSEEDSLVLAKLSDYNWMFFTSKSGVSSFFKQLIEVNGNTHLPKQLQIGVIGGKTALELEYYGYKASFISSGNNSEDFITEFNSTFEIKNLKVLLALGNLADDYLLEQMSKENEVRRINTYQNNCPQEIDHSILDLIKSSEYDLIIFTSPSTFINLSKFVDQKLLKTLKIASIGSTTSKAIKKAGVEPLITASQSNADGLKDAILEYYK